MRLFLCRFLERNMHNNIRISSPGKTSVNLLLILLRYVRVDWYSHQFSQSRLFIDLNNDVLAMLFAVNINKQRNDK